MRADIEGSYGLLQKIFDLSFLIDQKLRPIRNDDIIKKIVNAFLFKANRTVCGILLLYKNELYEVGQIFTRIIFELKLDFEYFLLLVKKDPKLAARQVIDCIIFEKMKQLRASNYEGIPDTVRKAFEKYESESISHYSPQEISLLKKNGFSMLSIEEKAKKTGHTSEYNIIYRNFSRNVHNNDFVESFLQIGAYSAKEYELLKQSRDNISMKTAFICLFSIISSINSIFELGFDKEISELMIDSKEMTDIKNGET